jgi:hypothetical protein
MAEPHATVLAGALAGAGMSSVTILLGAQVDALVAGLIAAVLISIWLDTIDNKVKAGAAVLLSSLLAGYGSPVAAYWLSSSVTTVGDSESLRLLLAVAIGITAPTVVPLLIKLAGKKMEGNP